ncbi:MAG: alpha-xylosidase, partial [Clostridia bacterium]|nr:alpha-xylosidase [Clostridia bacterium]
MSNFSQRFKIDCSPVAPKKQVIVRDSVRLTVIAPCLLRTEVQKNGKFCDEPTQSVWFRDFCETNFDVAEKNGVIEIKTEKAVFVYSLKAKKMLRIKLADGRTVKNFKSGNLKGTCRTLDITAGIITLGDGVCSKNGVAILDDSKTLAIKESGEILPRENAE